ncbi:hypothetical protein [Paenibacillus sonchi]|nr:hypothetical protein [Paenibacillus sonchi]
MTYPKELKEYPQLEEKTYPFRLFFNQCRDAKAEQNILFCIGMSISKLL